MSTWQDPDLGKAPEQLLAERTKRLQDAMQMKQPDRVPILLYLGYLSAEMAGITRQEMHEDFKKSQDALERAATYFQADSVISVWGDRFPSEALGDQMTKWPGYGLHPNESFQFAEQEFMKADDYDEFLNDPSDWSLRKYLPRAFSKLGAFADLPPFGMLSYGYYHTFNLFSYGTEEFGQALQAIGKAIEALGTQYQKSMQSAERMAMLGFGSPDFYGGTYLQAPFDYMSNTLRGMRGIMMDMYKRPDKLLEAEQKVLKFQVDFAEQFFSQTGIPYVQLPLTRGSDGFMSLKQFEKFYWPQLKNLILQLIERGMIPAVSYEGSWNQRLDYLTELPKGKTIGIFQKSDIFIVKDKLRDVMPIIGGMPNSMLNGCSVDDIRYYTKKVCEEVGKGGGFLFTTGIGEMEGSNPELVKAWVDAVKEFGQ